MLQCAYIAHIWCDLRFHDVLRKCASLVGENMGDFAQGVDDLTRMDLGLATFDRRTRILFHELPLDVSFPKKNENFTDFFTQFFQTSKKPFQKKLQKIKKVCDLQTISNNS